MGALYLAPLACGHDDETSSVGEGGAGGGVPVYTLDNLCEHFAERVCGAREGCCRAVGYPYDALRCTALQEAQCRSSLGLVEEGLVEVDLSFADACFEEYERLIARCVLSPSQLTYELFDLSQSCGRLFRGTQPRGAACSFDVECALSDDAVGMCDDDASICVELRVRESTESCNLTGDFCKPGLFCDLDPTVTPYVGSCAPVQALGGPCDPAAVVSPCGPGNFCEAPSETCTRGRAEGESCANDVMCASLACDGGQCLGSPPLVDALDCTG